MRPAIIYIIPIRASHLQLLNLRFELTNPMLVGFCFAIGKVLPDAMIDNLLSEFFKLLYLKVVNI